MKEAFKFANILFEPTEDSSVYFLQITDGSNVRRYLTVLTSEAITLIEAISKVSYDSEDVQTIGFLNFLKEQKCAVIPMKEHIPVDSTGILESFPLTKYTQLHLKEYTICLGEEEFEVPNPRVLFDLIKRTAKNKSDAKDIINGILKRERRLAATASGQAGDI